ncbi:MAG: hypothetical protein ACPG5Z_07460 [Pseudoalteromonas sp.]|uniref:hypothetical protein n=1 Tax=unclassified Pseudoalteromonas TaxID=194690 RepID=UPI000C07A2DC|nr:MULTISPECIES: hypothetical protein [unclassified Pseudoalteromonas]MDP2635953.1 hypothetical protein [Pseudoalteromonas sp. 1_MG-2023]PHN89978.1 hypothetical protein CSC79_10530 [Pseudoalteromonas sp. 3D05]TGE76076.1 hypothetical protein C7Y70_20255 [Pseudoalteromonas sp. KS88]
MSYTQKTRLLEAVITLVLLFNYLQGVLSMTPEAQMNPTLASGLLIELAIQTVVMLVIMHSILAAFNTKYANQPRDEREQAIALKAKSVSLFILQLGVVNAVFALLVDSVYPIPMSPVHQLVIAALLSEVIGAAVEAWLLHRG